MPRCTLLAVLVMGCSDKGDDSNGGRADDSAQVVTDVDQDGFSVPDDCDDDDPAIHPEATETCDEVDNDCDGSIDDDPVDAIEYFADADADGYGAGKSVLSCEPIAGSVENGDDCDDADAAINPSAVEVCGKAGTDEDCDSLVDDEDDSLDASTGITLYVDADGDGYGDGATSITACEELTGYSAIADDCDDGNERVSPAAEEICGDGLDNNCDLTAEGCEWVGEVHESDAYAQRIGAPVMYGCFGNNLTGLDANGDGIEDLAVASQGDYAALFSGPIVDTTSVEGDATAKFLPEISTSDDLGWDVQGVGDQDGDGYDDLVVQALWYPGGDAYGRSYLLLGPISGEDFIDAMASATFTGLESGDQLGYSPASGDVNGDGVPDILQGVPWGNEVRGSAYLFLGPVTTGDLTPDDADAAWFGLAEYDWVGADISANGDIDGDGIDDVALGAAQTDTPYENGAVWLFYGPVSGDHYVDEADVYIGGAEEQSYLAPSTIGGDLDADGRDDIAVAGPHLDGAASGHVWVFYADSVPAKGELDVAKADATITGEFSSDQFGTYVDSAGDLDADGNDDLIVSSYVAAAYMGVVWGYYGPVSGTLSSNKDSSFLIEGEVDHALGSSIALLPDATGDGLDDLAVGAFFAKPNGLAFVFEGRNGL